MDIRGHLDKEINKIYFDRGVIVGLILDFVRIVIKDNLAFLVLLEKKVEEVFNKIWNDDQVSIIILIIYFLVV